MCGINGWIGKRTVADPETIRSSANLLERRGPDASGVWTEGPVGLGHRRLSILDCSEAGNQPMFSHDGRYVITYNGEVFGFPQLRADLTPPGGWQTRTDTEVILEAYARFGPRCLDRLHGMFTIAIWDRQERELFLARDRLGVKPLYYAHTREGFAFASRPRAVNALLPVMLDEIDPQALRYYVEAGYIPAPHSIFLHIRKLPPAHYLLLRGEDLKIQRYWDFRQIAVEPAWENRSEDDLLDELQELVFRAVEDRLISDVPLGAFLSGGIDSSIVTAAMTRVSASPVSTFTIGLDHRGYDESHFAFAVAKQLGTDHTCEYLHVDDLLKLVPDFTREYDEPFYDYSAFPSMALARSARQRVTVALCGDGGDELFGGYHYYGIMRWLQRAAFIPAMIRRAVGVAITAIPGHRTKLMGHAVSKTDMIEAFAFARGVIKDFDSILSPEVLRDTSGLPDLFQNIATCFPANLDAVDSAMRLDLASTLPGDYLEKVDVASMTYSLEVREPLLDYRLVEWAMRLPWCWKLAGGKNKYLLRKLAYRLVPMRLVDRPKMGFRVPIGEWLRGPLKQWASDRLHDNSIFHKLPLNQKLLLGNFDLHVSGKRDVNAHLWSVLMLLNFFSEQPKQAAVHA